MTSADYSNTMRRRHRFVLVSVLLPLLLVVPAVRAAVGSKNQDAPSVKGNPYTRFCNSCSSGPDHPESCAKFFDLIGQLSQRIGSLDAKYTRRGVRCRILSEPAAFIVFAETIKEFVHLIVRSKSPNYQEHLLAWCTLANVPTNTHDDLNLLFF